MKNYLACLLIVSLVSTPTQAFLGAKLALLKSLTDGISGQTGGSSARYADGGGYTYTAPSRPLYSGYSSYGGGYGSGSVGGYSSNNYGGSYGYGSGSVGGQSEIVKVIKIVLPAQERSYASADYGSSYGGSSYSSGWTPAPAPAPVYSVQQTGGSYASSYAPAPAPVYSVQQTGRSYASSYAPAPAPAPVYSVQQTGNSYASGWRPEPSPAPVYSVQQTGSSYASGWRPEPSPAPVYGATQVVQYSAPQPAPQTVNVQVAASEPETVQASAPQPAPVQVSAPQPAVTSVYLAQPNTVQLSKPTPVQVQQPQPVVYGNAQAVPVANSAAIVKTVKVYYVSPTEGASQNYVTPVQNSYAGYGYGAVQGNGGWNQAWSVYPNLGSKNWKSGTLWEKLGC